ncbi:hypothetical protein ART_4127 [Arthrobacter sp. PAMC 25486]|nr:hypothetical protein ART_4127 [Arthrobacter sp. PAMC 25486]
MAASLRGVWLLLGLQNWCGFVAKARRRPLPPQSSAPRCHEGNSLAGFGSWRSSGQPHRVQMELLTLKQQLMRFLLTGSGVRHIETADLAVSWPRRVRNCRSGDDSTEFIA